MLMTELKFENQIEWASQGLDGAGVVYSGGQAISYSAPSQMGGKGVGSSPEDLFVSAVASCYTATLAGLLAGAHLPFERLQVSAQGTVSDFPEKAHISAVQVSPTFIGGDVGRRQEYQRAAEKARERCFIGRHLAEGVAYVVGEIAFADGPSPGELLDVRPLPAPRRHQLIFETLDQLGVGQAITLVNDHDPLPLRYQLEATRGLGYSWDYLEAGPVTWRVRIGRRS